MTPSDEDPTIQTLMERMPLWAEIQKAGGDTKEMMRTALAFPAGEWEQVGDNATFLLKVRATDESLWPVVHIAGRFPSELRARYGKWWLDLRRSEVVQWTREILLRPND